MNIVEINCTDIIGRIFNGYDIMEELNKQGNNVKQIVLDKRSENKHVINVSKDMIVHEQIRMLELSHSVSNVLFPYGDVVYQTKEYQNAELVHFHILHNNFISLFDYPKLMNAKPSVWTIHDPWILTGNCIYPLECDQWKTGCKECNGKGDHRYEMPEKNMETMWQIKKSIFEKINPHIVVSCDYMYRYIKESPLTKHFDKVSVIPFGVDSSRYVINKKDERKAELGLCPWKITIGFRVENADIKGCNYIYEALSELNLGEKIELIAMGAGVVNEDIKKKYSVVEMGWVDKEEKMISILEACDIFLMPSLAETFGLMAIESMAAGATLICFKDTVLEDITDAPNCGIAVEYRSSAKLAEAINYLIQNPEEIKLRGKKGHKLVESRYSFKDYISNHKKLYESLIC